MCVEHVGLLRSRLFFCGHFLLLLSLSHTKGSMRRQILRRVQNTIDSFRAFGDLAEGVFYTETRKGRREFYAYTGESGENRRSDR